MRDWYYSSNLPTHFRDLIPSVNNKDLAQLVTGGKNPALKNKCMNCHLLYSKGENSPQSKKYANEGVCERIHDQCTISTMGYK